MIECATDKRTLVGIPFYDGEGHDVLNACLKNVDVCLSELNIDAKIVVGINGPRVSFGQVPLSYEFDRSKFSAEVKFIKTPPGLVNAEKTIGCLAIKEGYKRIFLTDADISRLPLAIHNLWHEGSKPVVGANYSTYPLEILIGSGVTLTHREIAFMRIFEADKHPLAREFTGQHRPVKRLKGSLLLVDTEIIKTMFGYQGITSDSRMNNMIPDPDRQLVQSAAFMHYARVDITDHVQARLRHFKAAEAVNGLDSFTRKSLMYKPSVAEKIARSIIEKYPQASNVASDFLLQCALRYQVAEICQNIASGREYKPEISGISFDEIDVTTEVCSFKEAYARIANIIGLIDWDRLRTSISNGRGVTQENRSRVPIDLEPFLASEAYKKIILEHLDLDENDKV